MDRLRSVFQNIVARFQNEGRVGKILISVGALVGLCFLCTICSLVFVPSRNTRETEVSIAELEDTAEPSKAPTKTAEPTNTPSPTNTAVSSPSVTPTTQPPDTPEPTDTPMPTATISISKAIDIMNEVSIDENSANYANSIFDEIRTFVMLLGDFSNWFVQQQVVI